MKRIGNYNVGSNGANWSVWHYTSGVLISSHEHEDEALEAVERYRAADIRRAYDRQLKADLDRGSITPLKITPQVDALPGVTPLGIKPEPRSISAIARDIRRDWKRVNFAAEPYLQAMFDLDKITDQYYYDSGRSVVLYFLSNASTWRGPVAKTIKAELKVLLKDGR